MKGYANIAILGLYHLGQRQKIILKREKNIYIYIKFIKLLYDLKIIFRLCQNRREQSDIYMQLT